MDRRDMSSRFAAANALLEKGTRTAAGTALKHLNEMIREDRRDPLGLRDLIPHVLLQLDREQECYDCIKWWVKTSDQDSNNSKLPFWSIHGANACEPLRKLTSSISSLGLGQLVALTLLKLRLYLDFTAIESSLEEMGFSDEDPDIDRPVGKIAKMKTRSNDLGLAEELAEAMKSQYLELCRVVNDANPYFWDALVDDEPCSPPDYYSPGSREEAELVLYQCQRAWQESEDAILMIGADTASLTRVYEDSTKSRNKNQAQSKVQDEVNAKLEKRRGTGLAFPSRIKNSVPVSVKLEEFAPTPKNNNQSVRFVCCNDPRKVLVYTDGACTNNGQPEPRAGWAVVFGTPGDEHRGCVSGRLEERGPFGDNSIATSNRAELRAVIAALRLCNWRAKCFDEIVIATDSTYVIDGATSWAKGWVRNGWKLRSGGVVKNKDLWELLLGEVERWQTHGLRVGLLKIPRELNTDADAVAK
ncbi:hypothetical protein FSARC_2851 [Fusarium sarcochroum]|uniref:ribonuclease H n=1 Tax=Fusarium sarcochroum TaxID=1208366 RepID=A0A8H4U5Q0_9HYPO|nr:hypothetical protein FSARC_2851 [Fusarium sarcochroum]